jgi:hypothetical protein
MQKTIGVLTILGYAAHAAVHVARGTTYDILWGCHIAALLVGFGLIANLASLNAIGFLWSCFGLPLWVLDLATGGEWIVTSPLTHLGAFAAGIYGIRRMGMPRGVAWKSVAAYLLLLVMTRLVTPPRANVNLAFSVYPGWEQRFPNYAVYLAMLIACGAALSFAIEYVVTRERAA